MVGSGFALVTKYIIKISIDIADTKPKVDAMWQSFLNK